MSSSSLVVNGINPTLPMQGPTQRFIFDPSINLATFGLDNNFTPVLLTPSQTNYELRNNTLSGFRFIHFTSSLNTSGDLILQKFVGASPTGSSIFGYDEPSNSCKFFIPITFSGGVYIGTDLDMGLNKIINLGNPTNNQDAATKLYVDTVAGGILPTSVNLIGDVTGSGFTGSPITTTVTNCLFSKITGYPGGSNSFLRSDGTWTNVLGNYLGLEGVTPNAPLQFGQALVTRKIVLYQTANNDHQVNSLGVNSGVFRYQAESSSTDHVFYQAASSSASTEIFRASATGIGIQVVPHAQIHLNPATSNRKIILNEVSNDVHQFWGFGQNSNQLRYQVYGSGAHAFYASTSSTSSNLLMIINYLGYLGVGGATPNALLQFPSGTANRKIVLSETVNNDNQVYGFGVGSGLLRYQTDASTSDHAFYSGINSSSSLELFRVLGVGGADAKGFKIVNLGTPSVGSDSANKTYVDTQVSSVLTSITLTGGVTGSGSTGTPISTTVAICPPSAITGYPSNTTTFLRGDGSWTNSLIGNLGLGGLTPPVRLFITGSDSTYSNGPHIQVTTATDSYPLLQILNFAHNNVSINFDSYWNSSWQSCHSGSNFQICKSANQLQFNYAAGVAQGSTLTWTSALIINSSGQLGIGVSPNAPLQFSNALVNRKTVFYQTANNDHQIDAIGVNSGVFRFQVESSATDYVFYAGASSSTSSELFRLSGTGYLGIGTSTPHAPLQFSNTYANRKIVLKEDANNDYQFYGFGTSAGNLLYFINGNNSSQAHIFYAGATSSTSAELVRFRGDGTVGFLTTAPDQVISVNGNASKSAGGSSWATFSDIRLKDVKGAYKHGLKEILQLNPVRFSYNKKSKIHENFYGKEEVGLIAQDVEKIIPECIEIKETHLFKDTRIMHDSALTYMLINAVKELNDKIVKLKKAA